MIFLPMRYAALYGNGRSALSASFNFSRIGICCGQRPVNPPADRLCQKGTGYGIAGMANVTQRSDDDLYGWRGIETESLIAHHVNIGQRLQQVIGNQWYMGVATHENGNVPGTGSSTDEAAHAVGHVLKHSLGISL